MGHICCSMCIVDEKGTGAPHSLCVSKEQGERVRECRRFHRWCVRAGDSILLIQAGGMGWGGGRKLGATYTAHQMEATSRGCSSYLSSCPIGGRGGSHLYRGGGRAVTGPQTDGGN